ncbi:MAG: hypothetical protein IPG99_06145 [Ignavibacteria bacterium]|nr:hypothetical protein [Ignavibacteria bacterium]
METSNKKTIELKKLDEKSKSELLKSVQELINTKVAQTLKTTIRDLQGDPEDALEIIQTIHRSENLDLEVEAFGKNGRAGTLFLAAGKPGHRSANVGSSFQILEGEPYGKDVNLKSLRPEDESTVNALIALSGKKKLILEAIAKSKFVTDLGAKNIGIADNASEFFNKYAIKSKKGRNKKDDNSSDAKGGNPSDAVEEPIVTK